MISAEEELVLKDEFFSNTARGYFVEVGAGDSKKDSQTWHLERKGWSGILVEPEPAAAERLRQFRSAKVFEVACSSLLNSNKPIKIYLAGPHSTVDLHKIAFGTKAESTKMVPAVTLNAILDEVAAPSPIDFLSVDVEGHELAVLSGLDFDRWRPRLVLVEDKVRDHSVKRFMREKGYRLRRHTHYNGWYVPAGSRESFTWFDWWGVLGKYYVRLPFRKFRDASRDRRRSSSDLLPSGPTSEMQSQLRRG